MFDMAVIKRNWKTTASGCSAIVGGLYSIFQMILAKQIDGVTLSISVNTIVIGFGLIVAQDGKK